MKTGVMYVLVKVMFDQDVTIKQAHKFVDEMDYEIKSQTKSVSVQDTKIVNSSPWIERI
jgi:hypothetical protein